MKFRRLRLSILSLALCLAASASSDKENKPHKKLHKRKTQTVGTPLTRGAQTAQVRVTRPPAQPAASVSQPDAVINSNWNGGTGNWTTNSAWNPGTGFPNNGGGNTYNVTIGTGSDNVSLNTNVTISSLTLGTTSGSSALQNLANSTESLNVLGAFTINSGGQFTFENGSALTVGSGLTNSGTFDLDQGSSAVITGNLTNSGTIYTNEFNTQTASNSLTVSGTVTNNAGAHLTVGRFDNVADTMTAATLVNNGSLYVGKGSSLTLTNAVTSVGAGADFEIVGTFKKGTGTAFAGLNSDAGTLYISRTDKLPVSPPTAEP